MLSGGRGRVSSTVQGAAASLEAAGVFSVEALDLLHDARVGREPRVHVGGRLRVALERLQHLEPARVAHGPDRVEREAVAVLGAVEKELAQLGLGDGAPRRVVLLRTRVRARGGGTFGLE